MIDLRLEHTANLGPEADYPALLQRLAEKLRAAAPPEQPIRVTAQEVRDYVVDDGRSERASLAATLKLSSDMAPALGETFAADLLALIESHFAEMFADPYVRRSVLFSLLVEEVAPGRLLASQHESLAQRQDSSAG